MQPRSSMTTLFRRHRGTTPAAMRRDAGSEHFPTTRQTWWTPDRHGSRACLSLSPLL